jgi:hypothetical protein
MVVSHGDLPGPVPSNKTLATITATPMPVSRKAPPSLALKSQDTDK